MESDALYPVGKDQSQHEDPASKGQSWMLKAGLLAASSSTSFFNTVFGNSETERTTSDDRNGAIITFNDETALDKASQFYSQACSLPSTDYVLPPRSVADDLLDRFFKYAYIHWIDRLKFMRWYEKLWTGEERPENSIDEQINHAHLNIIFALAHQSEAEQITDVQERLAQTYFLRARRLLQFDLLELNRLDLIYALLLLTQWFQSVNDVRQCTTLVRLSILVANNLGLHLPNRIESFPTQRERQIARRAWHGCILMDRITAMVSGQPLQIPQHVARESPLFDAIDDEYLATDSSEGVQPSEIPPLPAYFRAFCELHIILGDVLEKLHHSRQDRTSFADINHILEVDSHLETFQQSLPPSLQVQKGLQNRSCQTGPMVHLHARFLHIKILLYRPFFLHASSKPKNPSTSHLFSSAVIHQGLLTCVHSAREILDLIASRMLADAQGPHLVPQRWHTVTYVYTATTILIAAHIFPDLVRDITQPHLAASIAQGLQVLDHQSDANNQAARRCKMALDVLCERHIFMPQLRTSQNEVGGRTGQQQDTVETAAEAGFCEFEDTVGDLWSSEGMESLLYNTHLFGPQEGGGWF
jgi:hypothetical protein